MPSKVTKSLLCVFSRSRLQRYSFVAPKSVASPPWHHKVDVGTTVDVAYLGLGIIKPLMGVADEGKTYGFVVVCTLFNKGYLFCIDVLFALDIDVVGMNVKHLVASSKKAYDGYDNGYV